MDLKQWAGEHAQIRRLLGDWSVLLGWLTIVRAAEPSGRDQVIRALRAVLHFFKTFVVAHCRHEEAGLFQISAQHQPALTRTQTFQREHERLGLDLDKFERQLTSYELSGDPTGLLTLGNRIIRQLSEHLQGEEDFLREYGGRRQDGLTLPSQPI